MTIIAVVGMVVMILTPVVALIAGFNAYTATWEEKQPYLTAMLTGVGMFLFACFFPLVYAAHKGKLDAWAAED